MLWVGEGRSRQAQQTSKAIGGLDRSTTRQRVAQYMDSYRHVLVNAGRLGRTYFPRNALWALFPKASRIRTIHFAFRTFVIRFDTVTGLNSETSANQSTDTLSANRPQGVPNARQQTPCRLQRVPSSWPHARQRAGDYLRSAGRAFQPNVVRQSSDRRAVRGAGPASFWVGQLGSF